MTAMIETSVSNFQRAQAMELCQLVDLEACWENLRRTPAPTPTIASTRADLQSRQRAYEVFHAKLVAYNKHYRPEHVPELLLNTPARLGTWCRRMRDLCLVVVQDPQCNCPAALVEKAYRCADRVGLRLNKERIGRSTPPGAIRDVICALDAVGRWCDALAGGTLPDPLELPPSVPVGHS